MSVHNNPITMGFTQFLSDNFDNNPEKKISKEERLKIETSFSIDKTNRIFNLDFNFLINNFPNISIDNVNIMDSIVEGLDSKDAEEVIKNLNSAVTEWVNSKELSESEDKTPYELRFYNYYKKISLSKSQEQAVHGHMVSIRATPLMVSKDILHSPTAKQWKCLQCNTIHLQFIKNRDPEPKKYERMCGNISTGSVCRSKSYIDLGITEYLDFFSMTFETLQEDIPKKSEPSNLPAEIVGNMCKEEFIKEISPNSKYEVTGILKMRKTLKSNDYKTYLEVMSLKEIQVENKKYIFLDGEKEKIREFLRQPNSLTKLSEMLGTRVQGFQREKKAFILMKVMQEKFNRSTTLKPKNFILHMLLCGDYGRGKSELIEAFMDICDNPYYLTASSTSGVGISGSVIRDEFTGDWGIQGGALSRASGDTLFLEEFDKKENQADLGILNEAMSKYSYTIQKANKYRKLKSNTSVVIVSNPKNKSFNSDSSVFDQINLKGDILSRFSFISAILSPTNIEEEYNINKMLIKTMDDEIYEKDKQNSIFIKKCISVASETNYTNIDDEILLTKINEFTTESYSINQSIDNNEMIEDRSFWKNITNPRFRKSLVIATKSVSIFHCNSLPMDDDYKEAFLLLSDFWKDFTKHPKLLNLQEVMMGKSLKSMEREYEQEKIQEISDAKPNNAINRADKILKKIGELCSKSEDGLAKWSDLMEYAITNLNMSEIEFGDFLDNKLRKEGYVTESRSNYYKLMR